MLATQNSSVLCCCTVASDTESWNSELDLQMLGNSSAAPERPEEGCALLPCSFKWNKDSGDIKASSDTISAPTYFHHCCSYIWFSNYRGYHEKLGEWEKGAGRDFFSFLYFSFLFFSMGDFIFHREQDNARASRTFLKRKFGKTLGMRLGKHPSLSIGKQKLIFTIL